MKCVILDDYQNVALEFAEWDLIPDLQLVVSNELVRGEELFSLIQDAEIIVAMRERTPLSKEVIDQAPNLKLIVSSGMRNASIDKAYAKSKNIIVCGTKSNKTPPMDLTWGLILGLARNIAFENSNLRQDGAWQSTVGVGLANKTLSLLGLGHIGKLMVPVAQSFSMNVVAWSPNLTQEACDELGVTLADNKKALFEQADFLSIHLVLSERSRHIVGKDELESMKSTAFLINTSRAGLVDQEALVDVLMAKKIKGAGLDVFDQEPLPKQHIFRSLDNVLATPHLGYVADLNYHHYFSEAVENILSFLDGNPIRVMS